MAKYLISYTDGDSETITADNLEPSLSGGQYVAYRDGKPAAYIPATNVRSIVRQDDETETP